MGLPALLHVLLFGIVLPLAAWWSARRLEQMALPPRRSYLMSVIGQQVVLGGISLMVARAVGIQLFPAWRAPLLELVVGGVVLLATIGLQWRRWDAIVRRRDRRVYLLAPRNKGDRALWVVISVGAGVFEEITYRGVLFTILAASTGSATSGALLSAIAFGLGHWVQGAAAAGITFLFAIGFQGLVWWSGSLYLAMAIHVGYDIVAGLRYGRLADRFGLPDRPPDPIAAPNDWLARTPS